MATYNNLIIVVEHRTNNPSKPFQKIFERIIEVHDDIVVPYDSIASSLRFLFGRNVVVTFSTELVERNK